MRRSEISRCDTQVKSPARLAEEAGIVVSSRVRLARNLKGVAFPGWAGAGERRQVLVTLNRLLTEEELLADPVSVAVGTLAPVKRELLRERHLISPELAAGGGAAGLVYDRDESVAVMINEEDHLRLQCVRRGLGVRQAFAVLERLDAALERRIDYAWSETLGYLTACPSNVGTGMRASVMMHLFGLKLAGEVEQVVRGLIRMGFAVRGAFGEGSNASGGFYQISNEATLGCSENDTIARIEDIGLTLAGLERHARRRLISARPLFVADCACRAAGLLLYARMLSSNEAMDLISGLRLGAEAGIVSGIALTRLSALLQDIQPGHLQETAGRVLPSGERDAIRADYIRGVLRGMKIKREP